MENNTGTTIKEYARSRGITHEAVRRQLKRYSKELEGHITTQGRTKYLDSAAVDFLDGHRLPKTVVLEPTQEETQQELEALRAEIDKLKNEKLSDQQKITTLQEMIISLQQEQMELIKHKVENQFLLEQKDRDQEQIDDYRQRLDETRSELEATKQELGSFVPSWFGLYKKK